MERIIKILVVIILSVLLFSPSAIADEMNLSTLITAKNIKYENCTKVIRLT